MNGAFWGVHILLFPPISVAKSRVGCLSRVLVIDTSNAWPWRVHASLPHQPCLTHSPIFCWVFFTVSSCGRRTLLRRDAHAEVKAHPSVSSIPHTHISLLYAPTASPTPAIAATSPGALIHYLEQGNMILPPPCPSGLTSLAISSISTFARPHILTGDLPISYMPSSAQETTSECVASTLPSFFLSLRPRTYHSLL
ncbi:hypothetical protein B0H19DRAFT_449186 [Mycena capillaripes]|nr:hypothetical protein B0H19DRAFT_449186 [Mycena capillaripes]